MRLIFFKEKQITEKRKKRKLSDILKRGENEAKKEWLWNSLNKLPTLCFVFSIFDKKSFVSFIFDLFAQTNTHPDK